MAVLVEIPLASYQAFIGRCDLESREYHVLRNAIIHHVPQYLRDGNVATLLCSEDDAKLLLRRAKQFYPIAASSIDYPGHTHAGIEELHLLHGILKVDDRTLDPADFIHAEAGSVDHRVWSETGCTCFLVTSTKDALF
jgi:anti-sigma factor ChrR (cupin superfamily)